ncbi:MAG: tetratricopeptide repeat protein [Planctomycetes bacterium]|nr:tetratricopeptide repeat protein [Planctomycetota bacterium]
MRTHLLPRTRDFGFRISDFGFRSAIRNPQSTMALAATIALGCLLLPAREAPAATLAEKQIEKLLGEAAAPNAKEPEKKLDEARRTLATAGLGDLDRAFVEADIERTAATVAINAWRRAADAQKPALRQEARRRVLGTLDLYERLLKRAEDNREAILAKLPESADPDKDPKATEAGSYVHRANYHKAWLLYRVADLADPDIEGADRTKWLQQALELFSGYTADGYRNLPVVVDCFLGQALCLHALKRFRGTDGSRGLIEFLEEDYAITKRLDEERGRAPTETLKRMTYLLVKGLEAEAPGSPSLKLESLADQYFRSLPFGTAYDGFDLEMAIARAKNLQALLRSPDAGSRARGYEAKLQEIKSQFDLYGDPWYTDLYKALGLPPPPLPPGLQEVGKLFKDGRYKEALGIIQPALANPKTQRLADWRQALAAAHWNLQTWREAHRAAYDFIRQHPTDPRAAEWCRRALQAGLRATAAKPPQLDFQSFNNFLDFATTTFPAEPEVQRVPWTRASLLLEAKDYRGAEQALARIDAKSPVYRLAQYGLALATYRQAEETLKDTARGTRAAQELLERSAAAVGRFADTTPGAADVEKLPEATVSIAHAVARNLLRLTQPKAALALLKRLDDSVELKGVDATTREALRLEAQAVLDGTDGVRKMLREIAAKDSEQPHLAQLAANFAARLEKEAERLSQAKQAAEANALTRELVKAYEFLLRQVGHSPDPRARGQEPVIRRHLANALLRLGDMKAAVEHCEAVLQRLGPGEAQPADILRGLAVAYEAAGRHDDALRRWRPLAQGLPRKTEGWYEAQCHHILCVLKSGDTAGARQLLDYFKLQNPDVPAPWKAKLQELEREMDSAPAPKAKR